MNAYMEGLRPGDRATDARLASEAGVKAPRQAA